MSLTKNYFVGDSETVYRPEKLGRRLSWPPPPQDSNCSHLSGFIWFGCFLVIMFVLLRKLFGLRSRFSSTARSKCRERCGYSGHFEYSGRCADIWQGTSRRGHTASCRKRNSALLKLGPHSIHWYSALEISRVLCVRNDRNIYKKEQMDAQNTVEGIEKRNRWTMTIRAYISRFRCGK